MSLETVSPKIVIAGAVIRYGFYLVGSLVLGGIGLVVLSGWNWLPQAIDEAPAFRISAPGLQHLSVSGHVVSSGRFGRVEVRQYGRLNSREQDLAVVMVMPPKGIGMGTEFVQDLRNVNLLRGARATMMPTHYDLENRFGEFRTTEMRVDTDGRWKNCLAFRSRLDTAAVYFTGWYCDASGTKPGAQALACLLDRLVLDADLASKEANGFLRARMGRAAYCSAEAVTQTTDTGQRRMSSPSRWSQPTAQQRY
ncbi:MAG TPA: hypothetical protein VKD43_02990 [Xanthobacteraceae bacterium]|nr:hypothetical protein [Xanthobacteraceae bacterium]